MSSNSDDEEEALHSTVSSSGGEVERPEDSSGTSVSEGNQNLEDTQTMAILERTKVVQEEEIERLQQELNESRVKHGEEVYWLRLELDSSRREKEAVEDRMTELYRDVQDILGASASNDDSEDAAENGTSSTDICTEPDYVKALQDRLTAYERSVDILNRQIEMVKSSSEVVVTSMKQEVSDLMEDKTILERDLLNQISGLDNEKRRLEIELSTFRAERLGGTIIQSRVQRGDIDSELVSDQNEPFIGDISFDVEASAENGASKLPKTTDGAAVKTTPEESFRSTATTQLSSFVHDGSQQPSSFFKDHEDDVKLQHLLEKSREEAEKWKREAEVSTLDSIKLKGKLDEVTKELMFTRSSANVALALDRIETDRAETLAHLDRITVLWDRADSTIQVMEGLLSEFQPGSNQQDEHADDQTDRDRLLSTLESATLVHGQIKMSLMLIELSFRNHLTCIQNENVNLPRNDQIVKRLEEIRSEALSAISDAEDKWTVAVEQVEKQILSENQSINDSLQVQLAELQKAQERHKLLQDELQELKSKPMQSPLVEEPAEVHTSIDGPSQNNPSPQNGGLVVSADVVARLQKEILTVVALVQQKNKAIQLLMATIDKHKNRNEVLKKELRVAQKAIKKSKSKSGKVPKPPKLELLGNVPTGSSKGKADTKSGSGQTSHKVSGGLRTKDGSYADKVEEKSLRAAKDDDETPWAEESPWTVKGDDETPWKFAAEEKSPTQMKAEEYGLDWFEAKEDVFGKAKGEGKSPWNIKVDEGQNQRKIAAEQKKTRKIKIEAKSTKKTKGSRLMSMPSPKRMVASVSKRGWSSL